MPSGYTRQHEDVASRWPRRFWLTPRQRQISVLARSHTTSAAVGYRFSRGGYLMQRREFIAGLGSAAAAWPAVARAQQPDRMRRIGVLSSVDENDPEAKAQIAVFTRGLAD